jgi:hypothetical protein
MEVAKRGRLEVLICHDWPEVLRGGGKGTPFEILGKEASEYAVWNAGNRKVELGRTCLLRMIPSENSEPIYGIQRCIHSLRMVVD